MSMMSRKSTIIKLALGLVSLTISLLLAAELIGLLPDRAEAALEARKKVVELVAVQAAAEASRNNTRTIETILTELVERDPKVLSAALRRESGELTVTAGDHAAHWEEQKDGKSTPTHVQVPIMKDERPWGTVELSFQPLQSMNSLADWKESTIALLLFVGVTSFLFFFLFLRRSLRELDPSNVIPDHVKAAFNALAEGVIIMDEHEDIVLANQAFADLLKVEPEDLIGHKASRLDWLHAQMDESTNAYPWQIAMQEKSVQTGVTLRRQSKQEEIRIYAVNGAPILDGHGNVRGALATFDDVSDLEKKNTELQETLKHLAKSKDKIKKQNTELRYLATRDPLTRLLNRRALFSRFERRFNQARENKMPLAAIMMDIDHFKVINDRYGHSAGDKVITFVGRVLKESATENDLAARYGGEEFCLVLPGKTLDQARKVAEELRVRVNEEFDENFSSSLELTISCGVAILDAKVDDVNALLNRADQALYAAKNSGRNRTVAWGDAELAAQMGDRSQTDPHATQTQLVQVLSLDGTREMEMLELSDRVVELDALIEEKSTELHRKHGFDALTGLPNRILFYDRVSQALAAAQKDDNAVAVMYIDIDLLERVDDLLGPVKGDELLRAATDHLSQLLHSSETMDALGHGNESISIARLADNEFGIAVSELENIEAVTWFIQRLFERLSDPLEVRGKEIFTNANIGISLYPTDGEDVETLVRCASTARHHAHTDTGHNQYRFYAEQMNARSFEQIHLEKELRLAIERDEFILHYQPQVDMRTGQSVAMEALIRWNHPDKGLIGPDAFIYSAEQSGLIEEIGDWVLRTACLQMKKWLDEGVENLHVAVNLSAIQLRSDRLVKNITSVLKEVGLAPEYLELEVTETALMDNVGKIDKALQQLRQRGVHIAIDDFGTGYSSLSHLKDLVVDVLKIDRSFIRDVMTNTRNANLVRAIIAMAQSMRLRVVAEGVETSKQYDFLKKINCNIAQGYLLSEPVSATEATALLTERTSMLPVITEIWDEGNEPTQRLSVEELRLAAKPRVTDVVEPATEDV